MEKIKNKFKKLAIKGIIVLLVPLILIVALFNDSSSDTTSDTSYMANFTTEQYKFVMEIVEYSYDFKAQYQILTSVTVAQAIEESGWGKSNLAVNAKNLFGMKGKGTAGSVKTSSGTYKKFNNWKESVEAHDKLLSNSNYRCSGITDYSLVLQALGRGGYCEGTAYPNKIKNHIESYNLTMFDNLSESDLVQVRNRTFGSGSGGNTGDVAIKGDKNARLQFLFPNGTPSSESAMRGYLTTIKVEILDRNGKPSTANLTCHKSLAGSIQSAYKEMKAKGFRAYDNGCFNWRKMTNSTAMSNHSFGVAVDINPGYNPYVSGTSSSTWNNAPACYKIQGDIVAIWKKYGFYWGGDYKNIKDYMHFEYVSGSIKPGTKY